MCSEGVPSGSLLSSEPLSLERYLFSDSSCDSCSLDLFEDIPPQPAQTNNTNNMDFIENPAFLKSEEFLESGDDLDRCTSLLQLSDEDSLIMWSPPSVEEASSSSSASSSCSSSPSKRGSDSDDSSVFSPDSGFDGGLLPSAPEP